MSRRVLMQLRGKWPKCLREPKQIQKKEKFPTSKARLQNRNLQRISAAFSSKTAQSIYSVKQLRHWPGSRRRRLRRCTSGYRGSRRPPYQQRREGSVDSPHCWVATPVTGRWWPRSGRGPPGARTEDGDAARERRHAGISRRRLRTV